MSKKDSGQATVEYILMLLLALSMIALMGGVFRRSLYRIWQTFSREISAACPTDCPADTSKIRLK